MDKDEDHTVDTVEPPDADLFGGESDYEDDVYRANEVAGDHTTTDIPNEPTRPAKKGTLLNLDNFWHNTTNHLLDAPTTYKNVLWDFMVFHNLREEREGKYVANVQQIEAEVSHAIKKAKVAILSDVSENAHVGLFVNEVAAAFDYHVMNLVSRFRVHSMDGSPLFSKSNVQVDNVERKVAIEAYLSANRDFIKLKSKLSAFRLAKNRLITSSLTRLLSSVDGMRHKVVSEVYDPTSAGFKRVKLTRFLRHMDKITNRSEFAGEYRFHLLKTFVKNKDELETFIQQNTLYNGDANDTANFEDFVNSFKPDQEKEDVSYGGDKYTDYHDIDEVEEAVGQKDQAHDNMMDFMNATPPDDILISPSQSQTAFYHDAEEEEKELSVEVSPVAAATADENVESVMATGVPSGEGEDEQLKLLEEARRKAAEILRLKRLNRARTAANQEPKT